MKRVSAHFCLVAMFFFCSVCIASADEISELKAQMQAMQKQIGEM